MKSKEIKEKALQLGFSGCGIIPAEVFTEYRNALDARVKAYPGSEGYYEFLYDYINPSQEGKSIIVCTFGFSQYKVPETLSKYIGKSYLLDWRIPYSDEARAKHEFEAYLKNIGLKMPNDDLESDVPSRWAAAKAGLGKFGRNNFIYTKEHGSYAMILCWVVDAVLDYDPVQQDVAAENCMEGCGACIRACPTNAMSGSYCMEMSRCVAHLSFNAKTVPDAATLKQMGLWMYGCDVCQDVCPMNKDKFTENKGFPLLNQYDDYMKPENILEMSEDTYINVINPRFWYIGEDKIWLWKCNALRIMVNDGDEKYHALIKKHRDNDDARISEVAQWGCEQLQL